MLAIEVAKISLTIKAFAPFFMLVYLGISGRACPATAHGPSPYVTSPQNTHDHQNRTKITATSSVLLRPTPVMTGSQDSSTALSITHVLRTLTSKGMIVVCSIHQPRSNIFSEFDKVLLLSKGKPVFYGARSSIVHYFQTLGALGLCHLSARFAACLRPRLPAHS